MLTSSPATGGTFVLGAYLIYRLALAAYRLYLHPLRNFPGPRAAALSETWLYNVTLTGTPDAAFAKLHEELDTKVLRVAPNEVHISDVHAYKTIYSQSAPFPKHAGFYDAFNIPHTLLTEIDPRAHKERRKMLSSLLSRVGVLKLEPVIQEKLDLLGMKMATLPVDKPIDMYDALRLLTTEVIMQFAFARPAHLIEADPDGFRSWFLDAFDLASLSIFDMQYQPAVRIIANMLPTGLVRLLQPKIGLLFDLIQYAEESVTLYKKSDPLDHPVLFDNLRGLSDQMCRDEAQDIMVAGADTTAFTLTTGLMHVLQRPQIHQKLLSALEEAQTKSEGILGLRQFENIDYLTAVVKESLRTASAVPGRLPRVVPDSLATPFMIDGKVIPAGTIVSMSAYTMHNSTELWGPDATEFSPERWLDPNAKALDQYLCAFSKGVRMCIGQNLATAELTMAFAWLFSNYDLKLPVDFQFPAVHDRFTNAYLSPGVKVMVKPRKKEPVSV